MNATDVLEVVRESIIVTLKIGGPIMIISLVVGLVISLFQALTQIQEMTLTFVPKILAMFFAMLVALPFMGDAMQSHMARLMARIAGG
jgi:flagellar biosynthesis protein FliQ